MSLLTRRSVLTMMAAGGALLAVPLGNMMRALGVRAQSCSHGELYSGFILLAGNEAVPSCVIPSLLPPPNMCGAEEPDQPWTPPDAVTDEFASVASLAAAAPYPIYDLGSLPSGLVFDGAHLIKQPTGEHYEAGVRYKSFDASLGDWFTSVGISANPDIDRPYPLWSHMPTVVGDEDVTLVKVNYTPEPGVFIAMTGQMTDACDMCTYKFMWIKDGVLYTLTDQKSQSFAAAVALASSLVSIP